MLDSSDPIAVALGIDLIDEVALRRADRPAAPYTFSYERDLTEAEVKQALAQPESYSPIKALRATHHMLARCIAQGMTLTEAASISGHSVQRASMLANHDRAFQELIAHYGKQVAEEFVDVQKRLASVGLAAIESLQEKLEDGKLTTKEELALAEMAFDRSVAPSKAAGRGAGQQGPSTPVNLNVTFVSPRAPEPETLPQAEAPKMIDITPSPEPRP